MLYDRIIDNKEVGRKIWKVRTVFNNDLYSVERFVLRWMTCTTLNDLHYVEWFVLGWMICIRWMICTTLNDLHYVEWFALRWMICTMLNDLYYVEWFALRWMICTTLNDLYYVEWYIFRHDALGTAGTAAAVPEFFRISSVHQWKWKKKFFFSS